MLIAAAVAIPIIDQLEDDINNNYGGEFEFEDEPVDNYYRDHDGEFDADGARRAAGWLVFVGSTAIVFHSLLLIVRFLYLCLVVKKYLMPFLIMVSYACMMYLCI